jgi:predicted ATPase
MITRIEIDGFKSFEKFSLDLGPFTVLAGPNNSGKSNLLEALVLLRDLAYAQNERPLVERERGTGIELFHRADDGTARSEFRIGIEFDLPGAGLQRAVVSVQALPERFLRFQTKSPMPLDKLSIQQVTIEPRQLRSGASLSNKLPLSPDGANLAAVMGRISEAGGFAEFIRDVAYVVGDLIDVQTIKDERRNLWDFDLMMRGDRRFTPSLVSDGTLRVLALFAAVHDPQFRGVVLIEELENGLYPRYQGRLCERLAVRVSEDHDRQVIATTHAPVVVAAMTEQYPGSVYFLSQVAGGGDFDTVRRAQHMTYARLAGVDGERGTVVPPTELKVYLNPVSQT